MIIHQFLSLRKSSLFRLIAAFSRLMPHERHDMATPRGRFSNNDSASPLRVCAARRFICFPPLASPRKMPARHARYYLIYARNDAFFDIRHFTLFRRDTRFLFWFIAAREPHDDIWYLIIKSCQDDFAEEAAEKCHFDFGAFSRLRFRYRTAAILSQYGRWQSRHLFSMSIYMAVSYCG